MKGFSLFVMPAFAGMYFCAAIPMRIADEMLEVERREIWPEERAIIGDRQVLGSPTRTVILFPP